MNNPPLPLVFGAILQDEVEKEKQSILKECESRLSSEKVRNLMESQTTRAAQIYMLDAIEGKL